MPLSTCPLFIGGVPHNSAASNDANSEVVRNVSEASRRAAARSGYGFAYAIGLANQTAGRVLVYNPGRPEPEEVCPVVWCMGLS